MAAAEMDARCLDLRRAGATYREIARQLGISPAQAHQRVTRSLDRTRREPADALRELELERLDRLTVEATKVLAARHVVIQAGKVVVDPDTGLPYPDHGPTLAAIRTLVQVQESRRKLLGLDAPVKVDARVLTVDQIDARIGELEALLAADDPDWQPPQTLGQAVDRFRRTWTTPGAADPLADLPGFVAAALELPSPCWTGTATGSPTPSTSSWRPAGEAGRPVPGPPDRWPPAAGVAGAAAAARPPRPTTTKAEPGRGAAAVPLLQDPSPATTHPAVAGRGLAAAYGRRILPDLDRAAPLNRHADADALQVLFDLERHRPWKEAP